MRFELDKNDLENLSAIEYYIFLNDEIPEHIHKKIVKIIKKLNDQIPDPAASISIRRIRVSK